MKQTILLIEDELRLSNSISKYLAADGFESIQAITGKQGLKLFKEHSPDLVLLDIMLPDSNGIDLCENIRMTSEVPIIFLTARVDDCDRLRGFEIGADDYICKPFNPPELVSRIKAVLRRTQNTTATNMIKRGPLTLLLDEWRIMIHGYEHALTQIEFNIIRTLMENPNKVISRQELLKSIHGKYSEQYERTIDTHIKNLRKKMNTKEEYKFLKTVYGAGYRLF